MKEIWYYTSDGGYMPSSSRFPRALDFKRIALEARGIYKTTGLKVKVILKQNANERDITNWVKREIA